MKEEKMYTQEEVYRKLNIISDYYKEKLKEKPSTIQIISLSFSCFALGLSVSTLIQAIV